MAENRKKLTLKKLLSYENLFTLEAQKALKDKVKEGLKKPSQSKVKQASPFPLLKNQSKEKSPLDPGRKKVALYLLGKISNLRVFHWSYSLW